MDEYLTTSKASPRSERTEVQCAYEVVGERQAETGTKENRVPFELPTLEGASYLWEAPSRASHR